MNILGICGSGRSDGITAEVMQGILLATECEYEYITLAGKKINGCQGCLLCAGDNGCKQQDDWNAIGQKMLDADAIIFGAPNYYGIINGLAHACLERTFCFRHLENFLLAGKLGVAVGVDGWDKQIHCSGVIDYIKRVMQSNLMAIVGTVYAEGYDQCYSCGYGEDCAAGGVVARHGFLTEIRSEHCPPRFEKQAEAVFQAKKTGKIIGSILRKRDIVGRM